MQRFSRLLTSRKAKVAIGASAVVLGLASALTGGAPAGADPKQFTAAVGVGSDTTQDIMNALSGEANGRLYTPVRSSAASLHRQLASWDAVGSECITTQAPGATFQRPNGSSNGRRALSRAMDGTNWGPSATACGGPKPVSGLVQFARSSDGPSGTGSDLTYIPFGRDALSFAFYTGGATPATPVTTLTSAQLTSLYSTGPQTINGVRIVPCGIQVGSGTYNFWNRALNISRDAEAIGTAECNNAANAAGLNTGFGGRAQESDARALKARGDLTAFHGQQVIIAFSAANFISQSNGVAASDLAAGVDLGGIDALGRPYTGTAPALAPASSFYASTTYGRDVYNVLPTTVVTGRGNDDLKTLFVGAASAVCGQTATIQSFGFLGLGANCGSTTLVGPRM